MSSTGQGTGRTSKQTDFLHLPRWRQSLREYIDTQTLYWAHSQCSANWFPLGLPQRNHLIPQPAVGSGTAGAPVSPLWEFHHPEAKASPKLGCTWKALRNTVNMLVPGSHPRESWFIWSGSHEYEDFKACPGDYDGQPITIVSLPPASCPWPSPFPLGLTPNLPSLFPPSQGLSQVTSHGFPSLTESQAEVSGRRKLRAASHLLTWASTFRLPYQYPWVRQDPWGELGVFLILTNTQVAFCHSKNAPSPEISSWTGCCLLKPTIWNDPGAGSSLELFQAIKEAAGERITVF